MPRAPRRPKRPARPAWLKRATEKDDSPNRTAEGRDRERARRAAQRAKKAAAAKAGGTAKADAKAASPKAAAKPKPARKARVRRPQTAAFNLRSLKFGDLKKLRKPKLPDDAAFRASTRMKAIGYGARELAWKVSKGFEGRVEKPIGGLWRRLNLQTRLAVVGLALLVLLIAILRYTPFPGVPCDVSGVKECAPADNVISMVPADSLLYSHLSLDTDKPQFDRLDKVVGTFNPDLSDQLGTALLPKPSGQDISFGKDIRPWVGDDAAVVITPAPPAKGEAAGSSRAFVFQVRDRKGADAFLAKIAPAPGRTEKVGNAELTIRDGSLTSATEGDFMVVGGEAAVRAIASTGQKGAKTLGDDPTADDVRDELPGNRFADLYVSEAGIQQLFASSTTTLATQLETFVDYGASRGFGIAAVANDDEVELDVYSALDPAKQRTNPSLFTSLPHFVPSLTDDVGAPALGYVGIGEAGGTLGELLKRAGSLSDSTASTLQALQTALSGSGDAGKEGGDKEASPGELLQALGGEAALVAEPTDGIPFASLIVDDVDEGRAKAALAALQQPLVESLRSPDRPIAGFREVKLKGGVTANELEIAPEVNPTYAVFDGKLVVSTQPEGIEQVAAGGGARLDDSADFEEATSGLPRELSALVFLDLDEVLDLAEALGRTEDPYYAAFRSDIRKLHAIAVGVDAGEHDLSSRMTVAVD